MPDHLLIATGCAIGLLVVVRAPGTLRAGSPAARHLLAALAALAAGVAAMSPELDAFLAQHPSIDHANQPFARVAIILAVLLGQSSLQRAAEPGRASAVRRSTIAAAVASVLVLVLWLVFPGSPGVRYGDAADTDPGTGVLILVFIGYVSWAAIGIAQLTWRYYRRDVGAARLALCRIGIGAALGLVYSTLKTAHVIGLIVDRHIPDGLVTTARVFAAAAAVSVAAGASGLALHQHVEVARGWADAYVANRRLHRMWTDLLGTAETWQPEPVRSAWTDALRLRGQHERLYRRLVDLRDAWMLLRPYFDARVPSVIEADGADGLDEHLRAAQLLRRALALRASGRTPSDRWDAVVPESATAAEELRWWLAVARYWAPANVVAGVEGSVLERTP